MAIWRHELFRKVKGLNSKVFGHQLDLHLPQKPIIKIKMNRNALVTGANAGIGKETARQLALEPNIEKVYMACRNLDKALAAKADLEALTGKSVFEVVLMDVSSIESVKKAVESLPEPIDALIMNAGGMGGKDPFEQTKDGVTSIFAANVLGHAVLVEELLKANKLTNVALYASSEAVRGVKKMGMKAPAMKSSSASEFASVFDGSFFTGKKDGMEAYTYVKYGATMWMSSLSRKYPNVKFLSVSPGGTKGTNVMDDLPPVQRFMFKYVGMPFLMPLMGMAHNVDKAAKRYVDGISDPKLETGKFYASKGQKLTGAMVNQASLFPDLENQNYQDNAYEAIHRFLN
jgi:NAD(P)-dependent dehydrogenase (short-subunit alcohol dehydrogenase family)